MFGCHSCPHSSTLKGFKNYEKSPCSSCKTQRNPPPVSRYGEDPANFSSLTVMHPAYGNDENLNDFKRQVFSSMSETLIRLIEMSRESPTTFQFVFEKIKDPMLSYSELAERFSCKKQNVLYHLKKAVSICPEIANAMIIDSRFSAGHHAVRRRNTQAENKTK